MELRKKPEKLWRVVLKRPALEYLRSILGDRKPSRFTDKMLEQSVSWLTSFVRGLFDADAGFQGRTLSLSYKNVSFLEDLQVILLSWGIVSHIGSKVTILQGNEFTGYYLNIVGNESYLNYSKMVSLSQQVKRDKLCRAISVGIKDKMYPARLAGDLKSAFSKTAVCGESLNFINHKAGITKVKLQQLLDKVDVGNERVVLLQEKLDQGLVYDEVVSVELVGEETVYDIVETESGYFVVNGIVTHNSNFMSYYNEMLRMCSNYFDFLSLINLRVDEIGANPQIVDIAKAQGLVRMGMAVEGIGERIRNRFLNKNLPFEMLKDAARNVFKNKLTELKMGMIITGYETEEDIDEGIAEFEELVKIRDNLGASTGMQLKFCVTESCLFSTDEGFKTIKELNVGDCVWGRHNNQIIKIHDNGIVPVLRVRTKRGFEVDVSENHPFAKVIDAESLDEFVLAKDLVPGMKVVQSFGGGRFSSEYQNLDIVPFRGAQPLFSSLLVDEDLAFVLGWLTGSGVVSLDRNKVRFWFKEREKGSYERVLSWLISKSLPVVESVNNDLLELEVASKALNRMFAVIGRGHKNKRVPSCILKSPKFVVVEYLKGLSTSAEHYSVRMFELAKCKNKQMQLQMSSESSELSRQVHLLLNELGILSICRIEKGVFDGYVFGADKFVVQVYANYQKRFFEEVAMVS